MFIRYGNTLINLDKTFCIVLEEADGNSFVVVVHSTQGIKCELDFGTDEGVTKIIDTIFEAIQTGESAEVDQ